MAAIIKTKEFWYVAATLAVTIAKAIWPEQLPISEISIQNIIFIVGSAIVGYDIRTASLPKTDR